MKIVTDEYSQILDRIRATSEALNKAGDEATKTIEALEKRLADAEPGITAWGPEIVSEDVEVPDEENGGTQTVLRTVTLGFGKGKKKWCFLLREELRGRKRPRDKEYSVAVSAEITSLRKAERDLRILALPHLLGVVEEVEAKLNAHAERLLPAEEPEPVEEMVDETVETPVEETLVESA